MLERVVEIFRQVIAPATTLNERIAAYTLVPRDIMQSATLTSGTEEEYALPEQLAALSARVGDAPESLALGNKEMQLAALQAAKYVFDLGM